MTLVRHNTDTSRVITACECGRTVSLPDYGISRHICECGIGWKCDGQNLGMYVRKNRLDGQKGLADGSGPTPN